LRTIFFGHGQHLVTITFTVVSLIGRCHQSGHAHAAFPVRGNFKETDL